MKSELIMALGAVFILALIAGCTQSTSNGTQSQGRAVFTVADAAPNMGSITSVQITVDSFQVQNATGGWITISSNPQTFDLMQLRANGLQSLLADTNLAPGMYGQVRMHISKVTVTDSNGTHDAKLPSGDLKIVGGFEVKANSTIAVNFDFLADKSLHMTGNGMYILAPVVRMQGREDVQVDSGTRENVRIMGGRMRTNIEVGMDENGSVGENHRISQDLNLSIRDDGRIVGMPMRNDGNNGIGMRNGNGINGGN